MCSHKSSFLLNVVASDWMEILLDEHETEVKEEAVWPTLPLQSAGRQLIWYLCGVVGELNMAVPNSACRLMERYLSRDIQSFLRICHDIDEWVSYRSSLSSRYYLLAMSCIQLAAKMNDLASPLTATSIQSFLHEEGVEHTTADIIHMEFQVYKTLDFHLPLWTSLEMSEYLASYLGFGSPCMLAAVSLITNMSEYYRPHIELRVRRSRSCHNPRSSSSSAPHTYSLRTLHICAGVVCAAMRYLGERVDKVHSLAALTRTSVSHIKAITDAIMYFINLSI